jgi:hypothetical protein
MAIQEIYATEDLELLFTKLKQFRNINGAQTTCSIDLARLAYNNGYIEYGNNLTKALIHILEKGMPISAYRSDKSPPVNDFILNSLLALAEKHEQQDILKALQEIKLTKE